MLRLHRCQYTDVSTQLLTLKATAEAMRRQLQRTLPLNCVVFACSCWLTVKTQSVRFLVCLKARCRGDRKSTRTQRVAAFTRSSVPAAPPSSCACENSRSGCPFRVWPETRSTFHSEIQQDVAPPPSTRHLKHEVNGTCRRDNGADRPGVNWFFNKQRSRLCKYALLQ